MDEDLENCIVLKLVLQPIVENAFVHGLEEKVGGGHIWGLDQKLRQRYYL